jgi:hypothetical protein
MLTGTSRIISLILVLAFVISIPKFAVCDGIDDSEMRANPKAITVLEILLSGSKHLTLNQDSPYKTEFKRIVMQLKRDIKRYQSEISYLRHIFNEIHNKYLTHYQQFSTIHDIFNQGRYDCVSASALFALIFESLGIRYIIRETNYHVYILVTTEEQQILIESTNFEAGFIINPEKVMRQVLMYENKEPDSDEEKTYIFRTRVNKEISLEELAGLQFYNLAIYHFNKQQFNNVLPLLNQALALYRSERILEFKMLLVSR